MIRRIATEAFQEQRIHVRSGFLALWALEATVPLLALAAASMEAIGGEGTLGVALHTLLADSIFGATAGDIAGFLQNVVSDITWQRLGVFGTVSALFVGYQLYVATLFDLRELLPCTTERTWTTHFLLFIPFLLWVGSLLAGGVIGTTAWVTSGPWYLAPLTWLGTAAILAGGIRVFGGHRPPRALLAGALVGATWLEVVKAVFVLYSTSDVGASSLDTLYQQLAFAPLAFLWMHLVWFALLLDATVTRVVTEAPTAEGETSTSDPPSWGRAAREA